MSVPIPDADNKQMQHLQQLLDIQAASLHGDFNAFRRATTMEELRDAALKCLLSHQNSVQIVTEMFSLANTRTAAAVKRLNTVRALHLDLEGTCVVCAVTYPCATVQALTGAFEPTDTP